MLAAGRILALNTEPMPSKRHDKLKNKDGFLSFATKADKIEALRNDNAAVMSSGSTAKCKATGYSP